MNYSTIAMRYFENPVNVGRLSNNGVKHVLYGSPESHLLVGFDIVSKNNIIEEIKFKAYGGVNVIAGASFLTDTVKGMGLNEVKTNITVSYLIEKMSWSSPHCLLWMSSDKHWLIQQ